MVPYSQSLKCKAVVGGDNSEDIDIVSLQTPGKVIYSAGFPGGDSATLRHPSCPPLAFCTQLFLPTCACYEEFNIKLVLQSKAF